jgi:iron-sulfur cluster assembly accessory protein
MEHEHEDLQQFAMQPDGTFKVTGDMIIGDLVAAFPQAAAIMLSHGLHCVGCHANGFDTVEDGARGHGMPDEEIMQMIDEINAAINHKIENIELTDMAVKKVKELRALEKGKDDWPLRIAVTPGGCAGFGYDMDFDQQKEKDLVFTFQDLTVLVDPDSMPLIKGARIDFVDSLRGSGFKIENPNAKRGCGCGKSFG